MVLPTSITANASLRGGEYAWRIADFPPALSEASRLGFACSGGQFQFRLSDGGIAEMYWLDVEPGIRRVDEPWPDFVSRCASEVLNGFSRLCREANFQQEAEQWPHVRDWLKRAGTDADDYVCFVAYFDGEANLP